jgi:hypothetical protein
MQLVKSTIAFYMFAFTLDYVSLRFVLILLKNNAMDANTLARKANGKKICWPCIISINLGSDLVINRFEKNYFVIIS